MKLKAADTWFSKCVRKAANYTCQRCEKQYQEGDTGLHCSHIFSRRHRTIRWCWDNAQALCYSCHQWYGGNPVDSGKWITSLYGEGYMELLREKMNSKTKVSKIEEKEIAKHYRDQFNNMEPGDDFESWQ